MKRWNACNLRVIFGWRVRKGYIYLTDYFFLLFLYLPWSDIKNDRSQEGIAFPVGKKKLVSFFFPSQFSSCAVKSSQMRMMKMHACNATWYSGCIYVLCVVVEVKVYYISGPCVRRKVPLGSEKVTVILPLFLIPQSHLLYSIRVLKRELGCA